MTKYIEAGFQVGHAGIIFTQWKARQLKAEQLRIQAKLTRPVAFNALDGARTSIVSPPLRFRHFQL